MKINVFSKKNKSHEADYLAINNELNILKYSILFMENKKAELDLYTCRTSVQYNLWKHL